MESREGLFLDSHEQIVDGDWQDERLASDRGLVLNRWQEVGEWEAVNNSRSCDIGLTVSFKNECEMQSE